MKIPRYNEQKSDIGSSRSLTTGTSASSTIASIGKQVFNQVAELGNKQNAMTAKLRRLEINTNVDLSKSTMFGKQTEFSDSLLERDDYLTPDNWLLDYEKNSKTWEKEFKSGLDEQTWKEYQPFYYQSYFEGRQNVKKAIRDQKIKNNFIAYDQTKTDYLTNLEKLTNPKEIALQYELFVETTLKTKKTLDIFEAEKYNEEVNNIKLATNNKYMMIQAIGTDYILSPNKTKEIDWNKTLTKLKDKNFEIKDVDGTPVKPNDKLRADLITQAKTKFDNQTATFDKQIDQNNKQTKQELSNDLIKIANGQDKDGNISGNFLTKLEGSTLKDTEKKAYLNAFKTQLSSGVKSWDTGQAQNAQVLANIMIAKGLIDTEKEKDFINELYSNGLMSHETYRTLEGKIDENIKAKNAYKNPLYKNAVKVLLDELGEKKLGAVLLQDAKDMSLADIMNQITGSGLSQESYDALNYFNQVLAEGEKRGFNYVNMLVKKGHENYIMDDILTYAKSAKDKKVPALVPLPEGFDKNKPYHLAPEVWFKGKSPEVLGYTVPKRNKGESVPAYLNRTMTELKAKKFNLPSTLTGFQFEQDFDLNTEMIVPNIKK